MRVSLDKGLVMYWVMRLERKKMIKMMAEMKPRKVRRKVAMRLSMWLLDRPTCTVPMRYRPSLMGTAMSWMSSWSTLTSRTLRVSDAGRALAWRNSAGKAWVMVWASTSLFWSVTKM